MPSLNLKKKQADAPETTEDAPVEKKKFNPNEININDLFKKKPKKSEDTSGSNFVNGVNIEKNEAFRPSLPSVNLVPETVTEKYKAIDLRTKMTKIAGGIGVLFVALYGASVLIENNNDKKIQAVNIETANLKSQSQQLGAYVAYKGAVDTKRGAIASKMINELDMAKMYRDFTRIANASGYQVSSMNVTLSGAGGAGCTSPNPFNTETGIGCISYSVTGEGDPVDFTKELDSQEGFLNAYLEQSIGGATDGLGAGETQGTVAFREVFFTNAYDNYNAPLDQLINEYRGSVNQTEDGK